ncbi:MAG: hypothetical protein FGF51_08010 [Candidatus Brockarchaeota archaeon]|nr:hypothetical protein [Candidatus Brockarchaeota archaeon]
MVYENMTVERLPVSERLRVLDHVTLYKTGKWWSAVALVESFGRRQIAMYVWLNKEGKWKRNQKYIIHNKSEWSKVKEAAEKFISQLD